MKFFRFVLSASVLVTLLAGVSRAERTSLPDAISTTADRQQISYRQEYDSLTKENRYGTPRIIELLRQGKTDVIAKSAKYQKSGEFLVAQDSSGNGVFHVVADADAVNMLAGLFRKFYGPKASEQMSIMINKRNASGETPLMAQLSAAHADTFWLIYNFSSLKQESETVRYQLANQRGMGVIESQNRTHYCNQFRPLITDGAGRTLLKIAQDQVPNHPEMARLARIISREIPCLEQN